MTSSELTHYGVKGMKWGVRRAELDVANPGYSTHERARDHRNMVSKGSIKRINRRMNKGQSLGDARKNEKKFLKRRKVGISLAVAAVKYGNPEARKNFRAVYDLAGSVAAHKVAQRAETKRGQAHAAATMGLPSKPTNGPTYAKKNKGGAYNISSL